MEESAMSSLAPRNEEEPSEDQASDLRLHKETEMPASSPQEIDDLFVEYMKNGDLESVLTLYEDEVIFVNREGQPRHGTVALREELRSFAANKQQFEFNIRRVVEAGDTALVHNHWKAASPPGPSGYALEVSWRQPDGTWRWLIGDPFTAGSALSEIAGVAPESRP
jgi:uncharacterized protein (TIGR02246 family)